ncbi:MAG: helix-turn-helix domain-containing protein, partial [Candidatus Latescibacterota bacterium]
VAFSGQGMRVQEIADRLFLHEEYVRELIRRFNRGSFEALRPRQRTGRPSKYSEEEISMILEALTWRPQDVGKGFRVWSLRKLSDFVVEAGIVKEMSHSTLGRILQEHGASFQRTKTWKQSTDPEFVSKKNESTTSKSTRRQTGE